MFDINKATHVVAYLLWKRGGTMSYLKLMKMAYFAEREFILRYGEPLTGASLVSMPHGPVLSQVYDLIKRGDNTSDWSSWIQTKNCDLTLTIMDEVDPDDPKATFDWLSRADQKVLDEVFEKYRDLNRWEIRDLSHTKEACPEWEDPCGSSTSIDIKQMLMKHGKSEFDSEMVVQHIKDIDSLLESTQALR